MIKAAADKRRSAQICVCLLVFLHTLPSSALGQRTRKTSVLPEEQLPAFAVSLVISLATEARSYSDLTLRPRVLARAADVLWDADNVNARALFKRAWEEAEKGDADDVTIKTKDNPPAMVTAMRRMSGRDLRAEVLSVVAKRDRALSEEFFAKLKNEIDSSKEKPLPKDDWFVPEAVSKRIQVASALLKEGQTEKALLLIGIANQLVAVDRVRAWEIIGEAVKEANRLEGFTGEDTIHFPLMTGSGVRFQTIGGENFSLANVFRALAKDDLYRAIEVAKSFKYEAPRATVTLAIASSILDRTSKL